MSSSITRLARGAYQLANRTLHSLSAIRLSGDGPVRPVFLVGAPRTGSTALYQLFTHALAVGYVDNLAAGFHGALSLGVGLSRRRFGTTPHGSFRSVQGNTRGDGLHAPHECGAFWYRWLPLEDHYAQADSLSAADKAHLRSEVVGAQRACRQEAFVFKNLTAGQRLKLIADVFPEARLIWCRRDAGATERSILRVRTGLDWPKDELWSIRPRGWRDLTALEVDEQIHRQVAMLEAQIEQDAGLFPADRVLSLWYDDWCADVPGTVERLARFVEVAPRSGVTPEALAALPLSARAGTTQR